MYRRYINKFIYLSWAVGGQHGSLAWTHHVPQNQYKALYRCPFCLLSSAVGLHCVELIYCWCCCQMLDGDYYERVKDFLTSLAGAEQTCASTANDCFQRVTSDASKVNLFSAY